MELYWTKNESAITETDKKYGKYVSAICRNILSDRSDAEECKNDTYLSAWNSIPPERPRELLPYLSQLARSKAIGKYRRKNAQKRAHIPAAEELTDRVADESIDTEELRVLIADFVRALPDRQRYIFVGRYYAEEKVANIAKKLKISEPTVYRELETIRAQLKQHLLENDIYV